MLLKKPQEIAKATNKEKFAGDQLNAVIKYQKKVKAEDKPHLM